MPEQDTVIAGLLAEREGYRRAGRKDREALVDEQLKLRGYTEPSEDSKSKPDVEPAADQPEPVEPKRNTAESRPRRRG